MINVKISRAELEKITAFTSKFESRRILQAVVFKEVGDKMLEIAATDGGALCVYRRPLEDGEFCAGGHVLHLPKLDRKAKDFLITQEGDHIFIKGDNGFCGVCQREEGNFPNYEIIAGDFPKLPVAKEWARFSVENLKRLENIEKAYYGKSEPVAKNGSSPHYWRYSQYKGAEWLIVLMPLRG